jgi:hypothetical protein
VTKFVPNDESAQYQREKQEIRHDSVQQPLSGEIERLYHPALWRPVRHSYQPGAGTRHGTPDPEIE